MFNHKNVEIAYIICFIKKSIIMKPIFYNAMAVMLAMTMSFSTVSCGDDDDNNEPTTPQNKVEKVVADYSISLSDDYYDLWDIEVNYTGAGGSIITEKIDNDWSLQLNLLAADEIPTDYAFSVTAKPKVPAVTLDPDKIYTLASEHQLLVSTYSSDGTLLSTAGMLAPNKADRSTKGVNLTEAVTKSREICNNSCKAYPYSKAWCRSSSWSRRRPRPSAFRPRAVPRCRRNPYCRI